MKNFKTLKTNERTLNKKVKAIIVSLVEEGEKIASVKKLHVAGCGYVHYYKNAAGENLIMALKEAGQITLKY